MIGSDKRTGQVSHFWLHLFLVIFTVISTYPILWVIVVGFSGQQALVQIAAEMNHPNPDVVIQGGLSAMQELQSYGIILGTLRS